ncbi:MAG: oxidoreductase [Gelidibacter sp.]
MKVYIYLFLFATFMSCKNEQRIAHKAFASVEIEDIYNDTALSIRAIELLNDKSLAFAANNGTFGLYKPKSKSWMTSIQKYDSLAPQFRAVAHTSTDFFMLSIENPALLYKTGDDGHMELVYKEVSEKVFYDAMTFWNDQEGIAIGDPTDDCMSVTITRDGGQTWTKLTCGSLPKIKDGEAAFAASNTNIAVVGDKTWVATGGKTSRILFSPDKGKTWESFETPMINGESTTGIYSIAFYDEHNGFAIGGDYTKPENTTDNKMITSDGGKTWKVVANGMEPGYRSCVQYVPNSEAKSLVAIGFRGIDFSNDKGKSWKHLSDEPFFTIRFLNDSVAYAAGKGRVSKLRFQ